MDLGGASTQIVFEPTFPISSLTPSHDSPAHSGNSHDTIDDLSKSLSLLPGEHVYDLTFAGKSYVLYQYSHLGYGLMQARRGVNNLVAFNWLWRESSRGHSVSHKSSGGKPGPLEWDDLTIDTRVPNPCMYKGATKIVSLDPPGREAKRVTMVGTGMGFEACRRVVEVMLAKDTECLEEPCAFAGVYQPRLREVFLAGKVWACVAFFFFPSLLDSRLPTLS